MIREADVTCRPLGQMRQYVAVCSLFLLVVVTVVVERRRFHTLVRAASPRSTSSSGADPTLEAHPIEVFYYSPRETNARLVCWDDFSSHSLMVLHDSALHTRNVSLSIDQVHREGLLHRSVWTAVVRAPVRRSRAAFLHDQREVLLLRRTKDARTCPGAWGFVSEHPSPSESWRDTALRGVREKLRLHAGDLRAGDLTPGKLFLSQAIYPGGVQRKDLQATKLFLISLREDQAQKIVEDKEVMEMKWERLTSLQARLGLKNASNEFCGEGFIELARKLVGKVVDRGVPLPPIQKAVPPPLPG